MTYLRVFVGCISLKMAQVGIIRTLHLAVVLFVALTPFILYLRWDKFNAETASLLLVLHVASCIVLMLHWFLANDDCFLTLVERHLRGVDTGESFIHSVVSPVYRIQDDTIRKICWISTPAFALASLVLIRGKGSNPFRVLSLRW